MDKNKELRKNRHTLVALPNVNDGFVVLFRVFLDDRMLHVRISYINVMANFLFRVEL